MTAVHFGAGNIGRGFVGFLLGRAGYELVFADVNAELIGALAAADSYRVHEVGAESQTHEVSGFRAIDSSADAGAVAREIAAAEIVTTAVGPNILRFIAPHIVAGLRERPADAPRLAVLACENAIGATDLLVEQMRALVSADEWDALAARAIFANTAVDRIVPVQDPGAGLDVTVETYFEWAIESGPFGDGRPEIPGVTWVERLEPYIERKLFTVNTGHATTAYVGRRAGYSEISEAIVAPEVRERVLAALRETKELLVREHGFDPDEQEAYLQRILVRFENPHLTDTLQRVGRQPLRKLSRHERFIEPASRLAALGVQPTGLLAAIDALLAFDVADDPESVELQRLRTELAPAEFVERTTGITDGEPLFAELVAVVAGSASA
ncbi:mannitol-1-phosphate 5-dehydrogenase [Leucobacter japonicus]|uniref:mannitol-1-phosphate 5-dehydrogenase n=1 Tax=Leucobacter japonicus TaxID=1461259 RepID=UPI0006A7DCCA|nr:mannitol-1-phosphate 5-dehydrogenase [Leucobacter japonicus]